jgi:hypothetical protein
MSFSSIFLLEIEVSKISYVWEERLSLRRRNLCVYVNLKSSKFIQEFDKVIEFFPL